MKLLKEILRSRSMENKILLDENKQYKFDFSKSKYVLNIHEMTSKTTMLSDVDFITATEKEVIFIEYKNANIANAKNPDAMLNKTNTEAFYKKIARKYYDSLFIFWACDKNEKNMPIIYILLIEHPMMDKKIRKMLKEKIKKQLPFNLKDERITRTIISDFDVCNLEEWREKFPYFSITPA